jgi:MFS family permease
LNQTSSNPESKPRLFYGYIIVAAAFFIVLVMLGANTTFGTFFNPISEEFSWKRAVTSVAFSLSALIGGSMSIVMGLLNDRLGPRFVLTLCGITAGVGFLLMSQINSLWQLYLFYGLIIGGASGGAYVPPLSTVARWFTKRRTSMSGIVLIGLGLGTLIMPPIASFLIERLSWRWSYAILGLIVLVIVTIAAQFLKRDPSKIGLKPYGEESAGEIHKEGLTLKEAMRTRQFWIYAIIEFLFGIALFTVMVHLVPHALDLGINSINAAGALGMAGGCSILGRIVFGQIADRVGNRKIFMMGFLIMGVTLFWLLNIQDVVSLYIFAAIFGIGYGGIETCESPMAAWLFGLKCHGLIFGVLTLSFKIGAAIGPFLAGYIFDSLGSYQLDFLILAIVSLLSLGFTLTLKPLIRH